MSIPTFYECIKDELWLNAGSRQVSSGIMGKNWVHINDGSGKRGTNDLTATTQDTAKVGDKVIVTCKFATGKDFGA